MNLTSLNFDTPNNTCLSLRILAEMIRRGELKVHEAKPVVSPGNICLMLDMSEVGALADGRV